MKKNLSEIELLDCAARIQVLTSLNLYILTLIVVVMLICFAETVKIYGLHNLVLVGVWILATLVILFICLPWRYKLHALAITLLACSVGSAFLYFWPLALKADNAILIYIGFSSIVRVCRFWPLAAPYAAVYGKDGEKQRNQVGRWLHWLTITNPESTGMIEFAAGSFWTGYLTIRMMNTGNCWAIAKFKKGSDKVLDYRVRELSAVSFMELPGGKWNVDILTKKQSFTGVEIQPQMPAGFAPFTHPANV